MKKLIVGFGAAGIALVSASLFAAFEAHVVNVTAQIENALEVPIKSLDFGTVFPQEKFDKTFNVSLSGSFRAEERMDNVDYFIRQKPKCGLPIPQTDPIEYSAFGQVAENENGAFICKDEGYVLLPFLCPYLSKQEITTDGSDEENDGTAIPAFHGPIALQDWTLAVAKQFEVAGRLVKSGQDISDTWNIDLKVPCFGGHCAQDWDAFVSGINHDANPAAYIQPIANEHQLYGCDLWLEVKALSLTPETSTVTVTKVVENDDGTGGSGVSDFQLFVGAESVVSGVSENFAPGAYVVSETGPTGYAATFTGDCDAGGNINVVAGQSYACTITNDDDEPTTASLTVTKTVTNNSGTGTSTVSNFSLFVGAEPVVSGVAEIFAPGIYVVSETGPTGYAATFGDDCNASGTVSLAAGDSKSCTILNNDNPTSTLMSDGFGVGSSTNDIANWDEEGNDADASTLAQAPSASGNDSASPDGGRFAKIGDGEWICREVNASAFHSLVLNYYWRGDPDAEDNETGVAEFQIGTNCTGSFTNIASHELDDGNNGLDEGWSTLQSVGLPGTVNSSTFALRFRSLASDGGSDNEFFRVDGVVVSGIAN